MKVLLLEKSLDSMVAIPMIESSLLKSGICERNSTGVPENEIEKKC